MPLIFFLSINKSFGFLNKIFLLVNNESNFLTKRQLILVMALIDKFTLFSSLKKEINKFPLSEIHFFPYWPLPFVCDSTLRVNTRNNGKAPAQRHGRIHVQCTLLRGPNGEKLQSVWLHRARVGESLPQQDLETRRTLTLRSSWGEDHSPRSLFF